MKKLLIASVFASSLLAATAMANTDSVSVHMTVTNNSSMAATVYAAQSASFDSIPADATKTFTFNLPLSDTAMNTRDWNLSKAFSFSNKAGWKQVATLNAYVSHHEFTGSHHYRWELSGSLQNFDSNNPSIYCGQSSLMADQPTSVGFYNIKTTIVGSGGHQQLDMTSCTAS